MYRNFIKRLFDIVLSFFGIVVLALPMLVIAVAIKIDDPGPAVFKQRRIGKEKKLFWLYKFRSMKVNTPDLPTHLLENPDRYISRIGRILRKTSLDELPQLYNIFIGNMSIIGPRPALWSQDDLIAERDKYSANDVIPGLTGWAQINGRDELEIPVKAKFDGEYAECLKAGRCKGFAMDIKCFFGTIGAVLRADGYAEGGTATKTEEKQKEIVKK